MNRDAFDPWSRALELAETAIGVSDPNPRVGCLLVAADGSVVGEGATQPAGEAHAEVVALRIAGDRARGATAYVTLEPCAHHGRTPPCCHALVAAGVAKVHVAVQDPNPLVAGRGLAALHDAGLEVVLLPASDVVALAARELNIGFFSRMERQRPWVRLKLAASLDGHSALPDGRSQWITGEEARRDGHAWRRRANAVLTGVGTVLADDPRLDVRLVPTRQQPLRVVVDTSLRTPPGARLLAAPGRALIVTTPAAAEERAGPLRAAGAEVSSLGSGDARIELAALLRDLAQREINELHVEAGPRLSGAWIEAGLVDELLLYLAPRLLGTGRSMTPFAAPSSLSLAPRFVYQEVHRIGTDLRVRLRPAEDADDGAVGA